MAAIPPAPPPPPPPSALTIGAPTTSSGPLVAYETRCLPSLIQPTPLPVVKLKPNTNLNVPPLTAWYGDMSHPYRPPSTAPTTATTASDDSPGTATTSGTFSDNDNMRNGSRYWRPSARSRDCFESLRLADCYIDAIVGGVDVVAEAETLKKLIATPFSKQPLSLIVHKIGKTLLLDNCAYLRNYAYTHQTADTSPVAKFLDSKSQSLVGTTTAVQHYTKSGGAGSSSTGDIIADMHREMIAENLYTRSLAPLDYHQMANRRSDTAAQANHSGQKNEQPKMVNENGLADPLEDYPFTKIRIDGDKAELDAYGRIWNFCDLNMLVDVNLPIFGCKSNPCVTLHPKDLKHRPINFLTGVDLYLDQSMCNAPEALLCWHMGGYVKEYEVIRTEDIPHLENSKFDPLVMRNVAKNIVAFLQDKVAQEGHTYWLFHDKRDDDRESMLRLWDLTPLCGDLLADTTANPFTLSVGILIYKVARNLMRRSAHKRPKRIANAAYRLLNVCLGIIDREKHPQVVACVYYLLANLYLSYGCDAVKRSAGQEEELERAEPQWAYDDKWQREYGEEYADYAAISIESLKKTRYTDGKREKPPKLRTLPNCSTTEDCCKEALEDCLEGLRYMDRFDELERNAQLSGKPLPDPMSFIREMGANIDRGREEADAMLKVDVRSILLIRAATAYRILADNSFILLRYGRTLRFARVGLYCCLAVQALNAGLTSEHAQRNLATAQSLLPAMLCHIAEALGNIACSSMPIKDQVKADLKRCYRDKQIKEQALACVGNRRSIQIQPPWRIWNDLCFLVSCGYCFDVISLLSYSTSTTSSVPDTSVPCFPSSFDDSDNKFAPEICEKQESEDAERVREADDQAYAGGQLQVDASRPYSWAFPKNYHLPFLEMLRLSERVATKALNMSKKIAPMSLFPPTANAIIYPEQLLRRLGNLKNCLAAHHIQCLKDFVCHATHKGKKLFTDKETIRQYLAVDIDVFEAKNGAAGGDEAEEPEQIVKRAVEAGKDLLLQGANLFGSVGDRINEALLLSNIGQLYRLRLHCQMHFTDFGLPYNPEREKESVLQAIEFYQRALTNVTDLENNLALYESISKDLAGAYFIYAVRLQDNILPGVTNCDIQKISIEIREFLSRAQSAYKVIRDSSKCSAELHSMANQFIVEIMLRFGRLAQVMALRHEIAGGLLRKQKDFYRQAVEHYNACLNDIMGRINGGFGATASATKSSRNCERITLQECFIALHAALEGNRCSDLSPRANTVSARFKYARRSLAALFISTQPVMRYLHTAINVEDEVGKEELRSEIESVMEVQRYGNMLKGFVERARETVKDGLQCLLENSNCSGKSNPSNVLDLWKNIYRQLLQIRTTPSIDRSSLQCLQQFVDTARHINDCFEKL